VAAGDGRAVALDGLRRRRAGSSRTARVRSLALGLRLPGRLAEGAAR
jgi:hypothetical protein